MDYMKFPVGMNSLWCLAPSQILAGTDKIKKKQISSNASLLALLTVVLFIKSHRLLIQCFVYLAFSGFKSV